MRKTKTRERTDQAVEQLLAEPDGKNLPAVREGVVTFGKMPGKLLERTIAGKIKIRALFVEISGIDSAEIQRNGQEATLDDEAEPGDTVLAIARIRGN